MPLFFRHYDAFRHSMLIAVVYYDADGCRAILRFSRYADVIYDAISMPICCFILPLSPFLLHCRLRFRLRLDFSLFAFTP